MDRVVFSTNGTRTVGLLYLQKNLGTDLCCLTKTNSKWIISLNIKQNTITLTEDSLRESL